MSVPNLPAEPNARRLNRAIGPVLLGGSLAVIALIALLSLLLARTLWVDNADDRMRDVISEGTALVAQAQACAANPGETARRNLDQTYKDWAERFGREKASFERRAGGNVALRQSLAGLVEAQNKLAADLQAIAIGKSRPKVRENLVAFRNASRDAVGADSVNRLPLAILLGIGLTLAVAAQAALTLRTIRWRLAVVIRAEVRDILEEAELAHERDLKVSEERATQALRAKQADLEAQAEALRIALSKAEESSLVKTAFLGNISHEIRTPLNGILATAEVLAQTDLDPEQKDLIYTIVASADQLTRIIGDILDLAQMEAGRLQLEVQPFDLRDVVREVAQPYQALATAKGVQFNITYPEDADCTIASDPVRLKQIMTNLVSNAAKFTHKGRIEVAVETIESGEGMTELRFSVSDTGIGIDPTRLATIFERFNQADNTSKRTYGGTGLGLTIAKQLVEVLGGQIGVNSERGVGSHFWIALPVQASSREAIPSELAPIVTEIPNLGLKVLVAEDNLVNQKMMQKLLQRCACSVDLAENGAEAVERAMFGNYDVILMDVHMPVMDGVEATVEIRRKEREWNRRRTPIVAVTADVMEERRRKFLDAGMDDFVPKPVRLATLLPVLQKRSSEASRLREALGPVLVQ